MALTLLDYQQSLLFNNFVESEKEEEEIIELFEKQFKEQNIKISEIKKLIANEKFTEIELSDENIPKYLDVLCFFGFVEAFKEFSKYIIFNYLYQLDLFEKIKNNGSFFVIIQNLIFNNQIKDLLLAEYLIKFYDVKIIIGK